LIRYGVLEPTADNLKGLGASFMGSEASHRYDFPRIVDNTMRCDYVSCGQKFFKRHVLRRVGSAESIHLVAGKALASGLDKVRQLKFGPEQLSHDDAVAWGLVEFTKEYGYDVERDSNKDWADSPKAYIRMAEAFLAYWKVYSGKNTPGGEQYLTEDGIVASELAFELELDVFHPVTGEKLKYHGRCDAMETFNGGLWLVDEKTTGSLGPQWGKQWDTRSQFMGYTYAYRQKGFPVVGVITRGVGILKTQITHMQVPVSFGDAALERWWKQVNIDFQRMVDDWKANDWGYNFADACNSYGKCDYSGSCLAKFEHKELKTMPIRVWYPDAPEKSLTVVV